MRVLNETRRNNRIYVRLLTGTPGAVVRGEAMTALWNDPGDITSRDLFDGPGGKEHQPHGPMKFIEEDSKGSNPKFDLKDANGATWKAKLGVP